MRILITGFDAFDKADVNPSQQAVERIDAGLLRSVGLPPETVGRVQILKTCCNEAWGAVEREINGLPADEPFGIILTGFAGNRNRICLERFALNTRAYRIEDNKGHRWQEEFLVRGAPDALRCTLPLVELMDGLNARGFAADISNYAGTFVCNETYFRALWKWSREQRCMGIIFVHVPDPIDYVATNPDQKAPETTDQLQKISDRALSEYARAFAEIAKFIEVKAKEKQQLAANR